MLSDLGAGASANLAAASQFRSDIGAVSIADFLPLGIGVNPPPNTGSSAQNNAIYFNEFEAVTRAGNLTKLVITIGTVTGLGGFNLMIMRPTGPASGNSMPHQVIYSVRLPAPTTGLKTYTPSDFGVLPVEIGDKIGFWSGGADSSRIRYGSSSGTAGWRYETTLTIPPAIGSNENYTFQLIAGNTLRVYFETTIPQGLTVVTRTDLSSDLQTAVASGEAASALSITNALKLKEGLSAYGKSYGIRFNATTPSNWTRAGGTWVDAADGMVSPTGAGDVSQIAYLSNGGFFGEQRLQSVIFSIGASGNIFFAGSCLIGSSGSARASLIKIDDTAHLMGFCKGGEWLTEPSIVQSSVIPALTVNRLYKINLKRDRRVISATLVDLVSGATLATIVSAANQSSTGYSDGGVGDLMGKPTIINKTGINTFQSFDVYNSPKHAKVTIMGDSISHGAQVSQTQRWSEKIITAVGGLGVVCALDGARSDIATLMTTAGDIVGLKPDWIVSYFGTNDRDTGLAAFQTNTDALRTYCNTNGIQLALGVPPYLPVYGTYTAIRAYLLGLTDVTLIRFDLALTANNDGVTFVPSNYSVDQIHPNATGHEIMFQRTLVDIPMLYA